MKYLPLFIIATLILNLAQIGCKPSAEEAKDANKVFDEVIDLHDEVMPKMSDLHYLKKQIEKSISTENEGIDNSVPNDIIASLEEADEQMMAWMANFKKPDKNLEQELALSYLNGEKVKMAKIKAETLAIIKKAENWIAEYKK